MSEFDSSDVGPRRGEDVREMADVLSARFEARQTVEREGLPPGYRMRADAHYVDQLSARSHDVPMRLVGTDEIDVDAADSPAVDPGSLKRLSQSIAAHGVLQPLLVRRDGSRYRLIAGRKRLLAAKAAEVARVPCLVHQADEAQAAALARAAAVDGQAPAAPVREAAPRADADLVAQVTGAIASVQSAATLASEDGSPVVRRVALDLVRAGAWRALWQLRAAAVLDGTHRWLFRRRSIGATLARVRDGFAAEGRLRGVEVALQVTDWNASADLDEDAFVAGVAGAIVAIAGVMDGIESPKVSLVAYSGDESSLVVEIAQDAVAIDEADAERFFESTRPERFGGRQSAIAASAARAVARRHGGDAVCVADARGCTVRMTIGSLA